MTMGEDVDDEDVADALAVGGPVLWQLIMLLLLLLWFSDWLETEMSFMMEKYRLAGVQSGRELLSRFFLVVIGMREVIRVW